MTWYRILWILIVPVLACGPLASRGVTPTPTKTPKRVLAIEKIETGIPTVTISLPNTPDPEVVDTPTPEPLPPTDTPTPEPSPTDTPVPPTDTPLPPPTDTPLPPPPPPTNTPAPPPPTDTPAPPPTPAKRGPDIIVELPDGNTYGSGDEIEIRFIVRDPDGVRNFTWGIFTQNLTPLIGGDHECGGVIECSLTVEEHVPPVSGTYIAGADAIDNTDATARGIAEIYVR